MSQQNGNGQQKLPERVNHHVESPNQSEKSPASPPSSSLTSELNQNETGVQFSNSPGAMSFRILLCPRCCMLLMIDEADPKCPNCKTTKFPGSLLGFPTISSNTTTTTAEETENS